MSLDLLIHTPLIYLEDRELCYFFQQVRVEFLDHRSESLWWVRTELDPPLSLDPIGEIGIGVVETQLGHQGSIVEGVVIETLRCKSGESTRIFWWRGRLVGA